MTHALASVSVVHRSVMLADAYATALMVLGPQEGYTLAERLVWRALHRSRRRRVHGARDSVVRPPAASGCRLTGAICRMAHTIERARDPRHGWSRGS